MSRNKATWPRNWCECKACFRSLQKGNWQGEITVARFEDVRMYGLSRIELILLPNHVREFIIPSLEKAGIEVGLSARKLPRNLKNEGLCYRCTDENAQADLLVLSEDALKKAGLEQLAILVFPGQSFFHELKFGSLNKKLRERVRSILYSLKES